MQASHSQLSTQNQSDCTYDPWAPLYVDVRGTLQMQMQIQNKSCPSLLHWQPQPALSTDGFKPNFKSRITAIVLVSTSVRNLRCGALSIAHLGRFRDRVPTFNQWPR